MMKDYRTSKHAEHHQLWLRKVTRITLAIIIEIGENNQQTSWKVLSSGDDGMEEKVSCKLGASHTG